MNNHLSLDTYRFAEETSVSTPALVYYPDLIRRNTKAAFALVGGPERLWPHVKTHKMQALVEMQMDLGIQRFKCATLAETAMVAACGAAHVLLAYPLVGPDTAHFAALTQQYPQTQFYALIDSPEGLRDLDAAAADHDLTLTWLCDVNVGMDRTGVPLSEVATFCREAVRSAPHLRLAGLHCYDGHIHGGTAETRLAAVTEQTAAVDRIREELRAEGIETPIVITGGSPTFVAHSTYPDRFVSPGTVFVWDWGYWAEMPELPFVPAGILLTRVVSHPAPGVFTIDLGYKAIASESAPERGLILELPGAHTLFQSEEHWTLQSPDGVALPPVGTVLHVIPKHICPTTALHRSVLDVVDGRITGRSLVTARDRLTNDDSTDKTKRGF